MIKGPDLLLKAFCELKDIFPECNLVFGGPDGGMLAELKNIVSNNGVADRVHFVGYLGGVDKSHAYHAATFLAIPSRHEAMSIVVLEAGICGTPVLLTDQCGFNQIAEKGGWVVPATIEGIKKGLIDILSHTSQLEYAGPKTKKYVMENFSWEVIIQEYLKLYTSMVRTPGLGKM